jgi:DNA-binding GntR family transcriptional regulator
MSSTHQFKLGPASLTEALFESLRSRIINGEIAPGEKVTEQRVADEYGVARPTAKSTLERLTGLGLLRRPAHRSAIVPVLDRAELEDLFFSRETFESAAVAHLATARVLPQEMQRAQDAMRSAVTRDDFADQVRCDIDFHGALVDGVGSARLHRMYELIAGEIHLTMGKYAAHRRTAPSTVVAEHDAIIAAIEAGDQETARAALSAHLTRARDRVLALWAEDDAAPAAEEHPTAG